jgi:hypothetical protein
LYFITCQYHNNSFKIYNIILHLFGDCAQVYKVYNILLIFKNERERRREREREREREKVRERERELESISFDSPTHPLCSNISEPQSPEAPKWPHLCTFPYYLIFKKS